MKLTVDIKQDESLRREIREMVDGQVRSVTRTELLAIIRKEAATKVDENMIADTVTVSLRRGVQEYLTSVLPALTREIVKEEVQQLVSHHVPDMLKRELPRAVDVAVETVLNRLTAFKESK